MYKFLLLLLSFIYAEITNEQLLDQLFNEDDWILSEVLSDNSSVYIKDVDEIQIQAIKITRDIDFNPRIILDSILLDIDNYNNVLISSTNVNTVLIDNLEILDSTHIIGKQEISIPFLPDLYYYFAIQHNTNKNRTTWLLKSPTLFLENPDKGSLSIGCGGWDYINHGNGNFTINYRLVIDIIGYPNRIIDYVNYNSLVNVFNDVLNTQLFKID